MTRIVFIGVGSLGFTRTLIRDLLTFPLLRDSTIVLMDINKERLKFAEKAAQIIFGLIFIGFCCVRNFSGFP